MADNKKSMWCADKRFEETSLEFLRGKSRILKEMGTREIVKDRDRQLKGIDLICDLPIRFPNSFFKMRGKSVDIKSIAKVISTFSFEISGNVSSGQIGWLINPNVQTEYYLLVYHQIKDESFSYTVNKQRMTTDNILYTKAILLKKEKLLKKIYKELHEKEFDKIVEEIRDKTVDKKSISRFVIDSDGNIRQKERCDKENKMWLTVSNQLKERPINIIVRREVLEEISEKIWEVDGNGNPYIS